MRTKSGVHRARPTGTEAVRALLRGCAVTAAVTVALMGPNRADAEVVTYRLTVDNTWSEDTHPERFPPANAHFSWLGGGTHNGAVSFWEVGQLASPGMVQMAAAAS